MTAAGQDVDNVSGRVTSSVVIGNLAMQDQGAMVSSRIFVKEMRIENFIS